MRVAIRSMAIYRNSLLLPIGLTKNVQFTYLKKYDVENSNESNETEVEFYLTFFHNVGEYLLSAMENLEDTSITIIESNKIIIDLRLND